MVFTDKQMVCADSTEELHYFAGKVGLDPLCFSEGGLSAHYVVESPEVANVVIEGGATELERAEFCEKCFECFQKL